MCLHASAPVLLFWTPLLIRLRLLCNVRNAACKTRPRKGCTSAQQAETSNNVVRLEERDKFSLLGWWTPPLRWRLHVLPSNTCLLTAAEAVDGGVCTWSISTDSDDDDEDDEDDELDEHEEAERLRLLPPMDAASPASGALLDLIALSRVAAARATTMLGAAAAAW
eukprot:CAMPEP_0172819360 /NCGR_PEP_ID=MMETSP1075-20121228/14545_1 /TAXON_ID=2916 /ORGANISM="Ceratium fusus, Strain PA161109" /LENGTH=165 /DNA_ID=CAMNT_0013659873 /DNA_START=35 /DNA_END=530 /DNA_ORIENTATION=+